jgi:hypothetical protein
VLVIINSLYMAYLIDLDNECTPTANTMEIHQVQKQLRELSQTCHFYLQPSSSSTLPHPTSSRLSLPNVICGCLPASLACQIYAEAVDSRLGQMDQNGASYKKSGAYRRQFEHQGRS